MTNSVLTATAQPETQAPEAKGFVLPPLPYGYTELAPVLSETTLRTHHDKHHAKYVETVNRLLEEQGRPIHFLEDVIGDADHRGSAALFNNAAQAWNHGFFWESMTAHAAPIEELLAGAIMTEFGNIDTLRSRFIAEGTGHFASGWVWLVANGAALSVISTHDAGSVVTNPHCTPLLVCDLWEHAYYLDYRQDRAGWLAAWWDGLANWNFAERQYAAALGRNAAWRYPAAA
jgi:superoxide dismutase, Fe-Mn family